MSEIKTSVFMAKDQDGDEIAIITSAHTINDIVRWVMLEPEQAQEFYMLLGEALQEVGYGIPS